MKSTLARNTRLNVSAFYYDYHDYQAFSLTGLQPQVANSDATVKGGEIELFTRPLRNFDFALSAAFLDSNVEFVPAVIPGTGTRNAELPQAPHVSLNALARYTVPVALRNARVPARRQIRRASTSSKAPIRRSRSSAAMPSATGQSRSLHPTSAGRDRSG